MMRRVTRSTVLFVLTLVVVLASLSASVVAQRPERELTPAERKPGPPEEVLPSEVLTPSEAQASPLSSGILFIENVGQFGEGPRFQMWGGPGVTWLAEDGLWITLMEAPPEADREPDPEQRGPTLRGEPEKDAPRGAVHLRVSFPGANEKPRLEPFGPVETAISYFIGDDPEAWRAAVPVWSGVRYVDLYPGVDLVLDAAAGGSLPWRLEAKADGASLGDVRLRVEGAEGLELLDSGQGLRVRTALGELALPLLAAPSETGRAQLQGDTVLAPLAAAPAGARLLAGPSDLRYATFLGGADDDYGWGGIAVDSAGCAYVAGETWSSDFPASLGPGYDTSHNGGTDAFVVKLNAAGTALAYATFLGGGDYDEGYGIAVDSAGCAYVTGETGSSDFPAGPGYDTSYNGGYKDAFAVKLNASGTALIYATFLGGGDWDDAYGIAVDGSGCAYVTGKTWSNDFPAALGPGYDTSHNGGVTDAFVVKLNAAGTGLAYATFLGGAYGEIGVGIAVDSAGCAYVAGSTNSGDFPAALGPGYDTSLSGNGDAFALCLDIYASPFHSPAGDLDGDGKREFVVWRPSTGQWRVLFSSKGYAYAHAATYTWGALGDVPLLGDLDKDGKDDLIVWRPSNGRWYVLLSSG
ncbi:MAG: hypothetical protein FJZ90_12140, partial [Chloroflexi bacterium]|nr:hypothetical protein [Chloroflexota bacterium]